MASEQDRSKVVDVEIGQLLAYAPYDSDDQAWPCRPVREVIEKCYSRDIESGLLNEQFNSRGVHGVVEGGREEQGFSDRAKGWAKIVGSRWPKTQKILLAASKMWERDRDRAVEWEKLRKLKQRL